MESIRVLIADDHELVRSSLRAWLEQEADMVVLDDIGDGRDVVTAVKALSPTVLILDLHFPKITGLDILRDLKKSGCKTAVLVMTGYEGQQVRAAIEAGARGFVTKNEKRERVIEAIRWVASAELGQWISPSVSAELMQSGTAIERAGLTKTEVKVLMLIEFTNQQIAQKLFISEGTVKNHLAHIYSKLDVNSRMDAAAWARKYDLREGQL